MGFRDKRAVAWLAVAVGLVASSVVLAAPTAVAGPPPCQTKNVRTGVEYKGASALANALTVAPCGAASPWQVTTVTPVAKWPRQVLSSRESRDTGLPPQ